MKKLKNIWATFLQTKWFIFTSWDYATNESKIQFFIGIVPAYFRFMKYTYNNYRDISLLGLKTFNLCDSDIEEYN